MIERFFIHLGLTKIEPDQKFPRPIAADGEKQLQEVIVILFAEMRSSNALEDSEKWVE